MASAPITHGSRMDHFYAVDCTSGVTYIGHCEQTAQTAGQINLVRYCVVPTAALIQRQQAEGKEYGAVAIMAYQTAHSKATTVALSSEQRVAIHILDALLKEMAAG